MKIVVTDNLGYGIIKGVFNGTETEFVFDYVYKNGVETEILTPNKKGEFWYLKTTYVEKDEKDNAVYVEVENTIYSDCTFFQVIDKDSREVTDYNVSYEDEDVIIENLNKRGTCMNKISKEEFEQYWENKRKNS